MALQILSQCLWWGTAPQTQLEFRLWLSHNLSLNLSLNSIYNSSFYIIQHRLTVSSYQMPQQKQTESDGLPAVSSRSNADLT